MFKLNDIVKVNDTAYAVTVIRREGLELYAVVRLEADSALIIHTFNTAEMAVTKLTKLIQGTKIKSLNTNIGTIIIEDGE